MWSRLSIVVGLLAGMAVAGLILGGIVFLGPAPTPPPIATPSPSPVPAAPSASTPASAAPSASASPAPSASTPAAPSASSRAAPSASTPAASGSAAPDASATPAASEASLSRIGGAAYLPVHDGALGGIGPDMMARGVGTILPGADVQP